MSTPRLLLREEDYGGVLATFQQGLVRFLNPFQFSIAVAVVNKEEGISTINALAEKHDVSPEHSRRAFNYFKRLLSDEEEWNEDKLITDIFVAGNSDMKVPTLSYPLDLHWEITRKCNLHCVHCYNNSSNKGHHPDASNLLKTIQEIEENTKLRAVVLSGGDPLVREDIGTIFEAIRENTFRLTLATNGTLISESNIGLIKNFVDDVNISLDSEDSFKYENFRGKKGAFSKCLNGIQLCVDANIPVVAQTTISKLNIDDLEQLGNLLVDLGTPAWSVRFPFMSGRRIDNDSIFLEKRQYKDYIKYLNDLKEKLKDKFEDLGMGVNFQASYEKEYTFKKNEDSLKPCSAGTVMASLRADGRLAPCPLFAETDFISPNSIWTTSLKEEWQNSQAMEMMRQVRLSDIPGCSTCSNVRTVCSTGCRAKAYQEYGTIHHRDPDCNYNSSEKPPLLIWPDHVNILQ